MTSEIQTYFKAEKSESLLFIIAGVLFISLAIYFFWSQKKPFYSGLGIPLLLVGLIQLTVGASVYFRTDKQVTELEQLVHTPKAFVDAERPRMEKVNKNFVVYRWVEVGFCVIGLLLILANPEANFWKGFGAGLLLQGALMLSLDYFAEKRGKVYYEFVVSTAEQTNDK